MMAIMDQDFMQLTQDLDVQAFWEENSACEARQGPRSPLSLSPDDHWLFEFMAVPSTLRYYQELFLNRSCSIFYVPPE